MALTLLIKTRVQRMKQSPIRLQDKSRGLLATVAVASIEPVGLNSSQDTTVSRLGNLERLIVVLNGQVAATSWPNRRQMADRGGPADVVDSSRNPDPANSTNPTATCATATTTATNLTTSTTSTTSSVAKPGPFPVSHTLSPLLLG